MTRSLAAACEFFLAASVGLAAPLPKGVDSPALYFPTVVGATAVYQTTIGDLKMEGTYRVTKVDRTRDGFRVEVERGASVARRGVVDQVNVSAKGLIVIQFGNRSIDPPRPELRLPAKAGDAWDWEAASADGAPTRKLKFKVIGEEEVEVPAGKFKAIRVEQESEVNGKTAKFEEWYAPNVGLVKKVFHHLADTTQVQELKSFTPGKE